MTRHRIGAVIALSVLALLTAGCANASSSAAPAVSTPTTTTAPSAAKGATGTTLTISNFMFSALTVKAGQLVTVTNQDAVAHTVNVHGTAIDVSVPANGQATFAAPATAGSYPLSCDIHPAMHGTLTVTTS